MSLNLEARIKNTHLTKTERLVANYFLEKKSELYFMTAKDIALALNTSDTSVIRLCRTLGYDGFQDMQKSLRKELTQLLDAEKYTIPCAQISEKYQRYKNLDSFAYLNMAIGNIQNTYEKNEPEQYTKAANLIIQSTKVFVAGFRGCGAAALHLGVILSQYVQNVQYTNAADSRTIETMLDMGKEDCLILIGGERYSKMSRILADMAKDSECRLIVITDKATSPLSYHAEIVFLADTTSPSAMHSFMGIFFIVEMLHLNINKMLGLLTKERLDKLDYYLSQIELF